MYEDFDRCYRAVQSKDARFDGWFVTAVLTTKIYCRPSCPVRPPFARNLCFLPTAAAAQRAGFRACKRCRPDASPGSPEWNVRRDVVGRAMRLIADGTVDRDGVTGLAARLGYSTRQLERHLVAEVGAGPLALARAQRAQTARVLIETTGMPFADVAFGSGSPASGSSTTLSGPSSTPRRPRLAGPARRHGAPSAPGRAHPPPALPGPVLPGQPVRPPGGRRPCPGARRSVTAPTDGRSGLPAGSSVVALTPTPEYVRCQLALDDLRDLSTAIARCRRLLDLDADPEAAMEVLAEDPRLAPEVEKVPGRRIPGTVDEVGTGGAHRARPAGLDGRGPHPCRPAGRRARHAGHRPGGRAHPPVPLRRADLVRPRPGPLGLPRARPASPVALVDALATGAVDIGVGADCDRSRRQLRPSPASGPGRPR